MKRQQPPISKGQKDAHKDRLPGHEHGICRNVTLPMAGNNLEFHNRNSNTLETLVIKTHPNFTSKIITRKLKITIN